MEGEVKAIYDIVWDVEGPLIHPGFDFAKEILKENSDEITGELGRITINGKEVTYFEAAYEVFDPYDDARWLYDRTHDVEFRHSTGSTPVISLIICALMGWDDKKLTRFARDGFLETPGCWRIHEVMKNIQAREFLVSNSYPAQCLTAARKKNIPFRDAYCMGYQFDDRRERDLDEEVQARSPLGLWREHGDELKVFLDAYLQKAGELLEAYSGSREKIPSLLSGQKALFEEIKNNDLRESLRYFLDKPETGVMGGHRKRKALQKIREGGNKELLFISDSIVDVDAIEYIKDNGLSVTINCTQEDCLRSSHVNIATLNWKYAGDILRDLACRKISQGVLERYVDERYIRVFGMEYIEEHMGEVVEVNRGVKEKLKGGYELWKRGRD